MARVNGRKSLSYLVYRYLPIHLSVILFSMLMHLYNSSCLTSESLMHIDIEICLVTQTIHKPRQFL